MKLYNDHNFGLQKYWILKYLKRLTIKLLDIYIIGIISQFALINVLC